MSRVSGLGRLLALPAFVSGIIVIVMLSVVLGYAMGGGPPTEIIRPVVREVASREAQEALEQMRLEVEGWKARALGRREIQPQEILVVPGDTVSCPPAVVEVAHIEGMERMSVSRLVLATDSLSATPGYIRQIQQGFNIGRCQQVSIAGDRIVCDEPRLGVLDFFGYGEATWDTDDPLVAQELFRAGVGLKWKRFPASPWEVEVSRDFFDGKVSFGVRRWVNIIGK